MSPKKPAKKRSTSFDDFYRELQAEVERSGPEAVLDFERMKTAYRISGDAAVRGLTVTDVLMRVFRRTGATVETLRQLREEWEKKAPKEKAPKR